MLVPAISAAAMTYGKVLSFSQLVGVNNLDV